MSSINKKIDDIANEHYAGNNSAFAKVMGTSEANIRNYRKETMPKLEFVVKLREIFEISFDYLLSDYVDPAKSKIGEPSTIYKLKTDRSIKDQRVPLYDIEATAGMVELFRNKNGKTKPVDFISIPNLPKCDGAIYVTGDSMYPLLKSGDIVMYKELNNSIDNIFFGEMYLLSINMDGEEFVTVKWIHKSDKGDDFIKIVSQNSHHQAKDVHLKNIKALALIKASIRINSMS
ncbi:LexA family transcriptional regulator [Flavobacterium sp. LS1P28]|uniref:S24 family peptidase n=2 Tax=unclassified Flavobacterium TaxID=196869 RepID=UPI000F833657|nr:S24 family peptidase [Flavobacterium sp. LS1P28]RTY80716.1 LexA family transcriptional regulator [Flavobacterium sp. LS1P28]